MLIIDFTARLSRLNPRLIVRSDQATKRQGLKHAGIYLKEQQQRGLSYDVKGKGPAGIEKYYAELAAGRLDKYICGVCIEWLPEFDVFNEEYSCVSVPGWRTVLLRLIESKVFKLEDARRIFNCQSLGETDYDKMSIFKKMEFAKRLDNA